MKQGKASAQKVYSDLIKRLKAKSSGLSAEEFMAQDMANALRIRPALLITGNGRKA